MKAIQLFFLLLLPTFLMGQPLLTFESHALKSGVNNPMTFCSYLPAGADGAQIQWDFSQLKALRSFTGALADAGVTGFESANTELEEFGVRFFYNVSEQGINHYGYVSADGRTQVVFDEPFEKIRFPFAYRDNYTSDFSGIYMSNGNKLGNITGNASVRADAWGTIKLPGNTIFENTLRVKEEKTYQIEFESGTQKVNMTTYRWYNAHHRYPLLVLIETEVFLANSSSKSTQAAYNVNAVKNTTANAEKLSGENMVYVYPNPVTDRLTLKVIASSASLASISLTDLSGRTLVALPARMLQAGENHVVLESEIATVPEGFYLVRISLGGEIHTTQVSIVK
ncbi:MAG: T9SS type A sorting domain-containing protein [Bacteroidota bacterium]|nr:MAG: T9SS type A sorting domain-containing protein [Bacteroidota bacterium]